MLYLLSALKPRLKFGMEDELNEWKQVCQVKTSIWSDTTKGRKTSVFLKRLWWFILSSFLL